MRARGIPRRVAAVAVALVAAMLVAGGSANADPAVIQVHPGPHAIQDALEQAKRNDILELHAGIYRQPHALRVDKSVVIRSAGDGVVTISGMCKVNDTIVLAANNVRLRGLRVVGAADGFGFFPSEIDFNGIRTGEVSNSIAQDTCDEPAEYGINVFNGGPIKVLDNETFGFTDSGIYIGGINDTGNGTLMVRGNLTHGNDRGIIVEDSTARVVVLENVVRHNRLQGEFPTNTGIFLHASDGVRVRGNTVTNNGEDGIWLDENSDHNRVIGNVVHGHTTDLRNDGQSNCFSDNDYDTAGGTQDVTEPCGGGPG
jgi:parallel beta-helix repeat protein